MNKRMLQDIWKSIATKSKGVFRALIVRSRALCKKSLNAGKSIAIKVKGAFIVVSNVGKALLNKSKSVCSALFSRVRNICKTSLNVGKIFVGKVKSAFIVIPNAGIALAIKSKEVFLSPIAYTIYTVIACVLGASLGAYFYLSYVKSPDLVVQEQKLSLQDDSVYHKNLEEKNRQLEQKLTTTQAQLRELEHAHEKLQQAHAKKMATVDSDVIDSKIDRAVEKQFKVLKEEIVAQQKESQRKQVIKQFVDRLAK